MQPGQQSVEGGENLRLWLVELEPGIGDKFFVISSRYSKPFTMRKSRPKTTVAARQ
jgi:hypothetical protein